MSNPVKKTERAAAIAAAIRSRPGIKGKRLGVTKTRGEYNVFLVGTTGGDDRKGRFLIWRGTIDGIQP